VTPDGTRVNGEDIVAEEKSPGVQKLLAWAKVLGAIAVLLGAGVSVFTSLGLDKLVASRAKENTAETKAVFDTLKAKVDAQKNTILALLDEVEDLKEDLEDLEDDFKEDRRLGMWARLTRSTTPTVAAPPPPEPEAKPRTPRGGLLGTILDGGKKPRSKARKILEDAEPLPEFGQLQEQVQEQLQEEGGL